MNRSLTPYSWSRHMSEAYVVGMWVVAAWWLQTVLVVSVAPEFGLVWSSSHDAYLYFGVFSATIAGATVASETGHLRVPVKKRVLSTLLAGTVSFILTLIGLLILRWLIQYFAVAELTTLVQTGSLFSLRYTILLWVWAGVATALGPLVVRRGAQWRTQLGAGVVASIFGAAVWNNTVVMVYSDLYVASLVGPLAWGMLYTALAWPFPDQIFAGWIRVLTGPRAGHRIPIGEGDTVVERIIGHYPRGLDLHLGAENGVAELHASVLRRADGTFAIRGLSQSPTLLRRMLERVDLRYDVRRPAPLEADLEMEDVMIFEYGSASTSVEFLLLPRGHR